ncbi:MAG: 50S ribosomal protein L7/L12 [Candidatus Moranbacteria bacterium]|nr:50S ribosomal protein L7/L12 [Candidatus Moranbacteria bacterium]
MTEEAKQEEKKEVEVPEKFKALVSEIEKMSVLELSELVKVLEEKFGVSAAAPMMMAGAPAAGSEAGEAADEKSEFDIELVAAGDAKINVIKVVREITGQGLKDAKDLVDAAPKVIKEKAPKAEAEEIKKKLEEAGAPFKIAKKSIPLKTSKESPFFEDT